jgi:hypothetical protein
MTEVNRLKYSLTFPTSSYLREVVPLIEIDVETYEFNTKNILRKISSVTGMLNEDILSNLTTVLQEMVDKDDGYSFEVFDVIRFYTRGTDILSINFPTNSSGKGVFVNLDLYKNVGEPTQRFPWGITLVTAFGSGLLVGLISNMW